MKGSGWCGHWFSVGHWFSKVVVPPSSTSGKAENAMSCPVNLSLGPSSKFMGVY